MKIAFHSSYLGFRGTEVALMDYAWGNRELLGHESLFLLPWRQDAESHPVVPFMQKTAPVRFYRDPEEREAILREESADFFYCVKNGFNDGVFSRAVPTGIHAIFRESEFHGDVYAYISGWLSKVMAYGRAAVAPWMVRLAETQGTLRQELGIPAGAFVFGRHGGDDSFDIPWVQQAVVQAARKDPNLWFLFLNTREFGGPSRPANLRFFPGTPDPMAKRVFLNSCDAMIHGRQRGETLGMACLEFALLGKPVLTYAGSPEQAHLDVLGDAAVRYGSASQLLSLLTHPASFPGPAETKAGADRFKDYQPKAVMERFREVFLA